MAFSNYEFPNANFYDSDLRELIRMYKELLKIYQNLKQEIQDTIDFVNAFEEHAQDLIKHEIAIVMSQYLQRLTAVEALVAELERQLGQETGQIRQLRIDLEALQLTVFQNYQELKSDYMTLLQLFHDYKHSIELIYDGKQQELERYIIEHVTHLERLEVINPITGRYENVQLVLDQIVKSMSQSYGLTAAEYDAMQLTAFEYDSKRITALEYSTKAYFIFWNIRQGLIRDPFSGSMLNFERVIQKLADLHRYSLTAKEYDNLELEAIMYDNKQITAKQYDWAGKRYVQGLIPDSSITAKRYSDLSFDHYGHVFVPNINE